MSHREEIRKAFDRHIKENKGLITAPDKLLDLVCEAIGETDQVEVSGWRLVRHLGGDPVFKGCGVRGQARRYYGWVATHLETGHIELIPPSTGDEPLALAKRYAEGKYKLFTLTGEWE